MTYTENCSDESTKNSNLHNEINTLDIFNILQNIAFYTIRNCLQSTYSCIYLHVWFLTCTLYKMLQYFIAQPDEDELHIILAPKCGSHQHKQEFSNLQVISGVDYELAIAVGALI